MNPGSKVYSEATAHDIDEEVARITHEIYAHVQEILRTRRDALERLARRLLDTEVLEGEELQQLLNSDSPLSDTTPMTVAAAS